MDCQARGKKVRIIHHRETLYLRWTYASLLNVKCIYIMNAYKDTGCQGKPSHLMAISFAFSLEWRGGTGR